MNQKGFSVLIVVLLVAVLGSISTYLFIRSSNEDSNIPNTSNQENTQEQIEDSVRQKILQSDSGFNSNYNFSITHISRNFARGEITDNDQTKNVYLALTSGDWKVIEINEESISCEKADKVGIPNDMASDCLFIHPDAEDPSEVLKKNKDELISAEKIEVIGRFNFGQDPDNKTIEIVSDDGDAVVVTYNDIDDQTLQTIENLDDDDYVVVTVNTNEGEDGEVELNLEIIEEIELTDDDDSDDGNIGDQGSLDDDPGDDSDLDNSGSNTGPEDSTNTSDSNNSTGDDSDQTNNQSTDSNDQNDLGNQSPNNQTNPDDDDEQTNLGEDPGDPNYVENLTTDTPDDYESLLDIDNSGLDIKIISDF